jgi:uncharacterized protein (DUF58 family)
MLRRRQFAGARAYGSFRRLHRQICRYRGFTQRMKKQYELYVRRSRRGELSLEQVTLVVADDSGKFKSRLYDVSATREFLKKVGRALKIIDKEAGEQ